jgi:hypothetical protein
VKKSKNPRKETLVEKEEAESFSLDKASMKDTVGPEYQPGCIILRVGNLAD